MIGIPPITLFDNTNACCGIQNVTITLEAECHSKCLNLGECFIRNLKTGEILIEPPVTINENILGMHIKVADITDTIKTTVQKQLNELATTFKFRLGHTMYNMTGLINTIISSNLEDGEDLDCPTTLGLVHTSGRGSNGEESMSLSGTILDKIIAPLVDTVGGVLGQGGTAGERTGEDGSSGVEGGREAAAGEVVDTTQWV